MSYVIGMLVVLVPCILGAFAIAIPIRSYLATKKNRFLIVGVINGAFCGLSILALLAAVVVNGYAILPFPIIAIGFLAMLLLEATKRIGK